MGGLRDMNFFLQADIVAMFAQPSFAGMILHGFEGGVGVFDPDLKGLDFLQAVLGQEDLDSL